MSDLGKAPVLFITFNRPQTTEKVFEEIRKYRPNRLYLACDGPRPHVASDKSLNEEVKAIIEDVDWDCEVFKHFNSKNQGMRDGVRNAIDWFFKNEEEGIILEDDVLPGQDFFVFCSHMLEKYRLDSRVMHISGCNLQFGKKWGDGSYYFSRLTNIWGWATWRRSWLLYDADMDNYPLFKSQGRYKDILIGDRNKWFLKIILDFVYKKKNTWDYPWQYQVLIQNGLAITPQVNLITNIGYGDGATTSSDIKTKLAHLEIEVLNEIIHPKFVIPHTKADSNFNRITLHQIPFYKRVWRKIIKEIKKTLQAQ